MHWHALTGINLHTDSFTKQIILVKLEIIQINKQWYSSILFYSEVKHNFG